MRNLREFSLGYKSFTSTALFCSIISSVIGTGTTLGIAEKTYMFGAVIVLCQIFTPILWFFQSLIIPAGIERVKRCITIGDIMNEFYGPIGRYVAAISSVILSYGAMVVQGIAMGYLFNYFFGLDPVYGMIIGYSILISYSVLGGINSVVQTEVFKASIFFVFIPASFAIASAKVGGFGNFIDVLPDSYSQINFDTETNLKIMGLIFYSILPRYDAAFINRCLMVPDAKKLRVCLRNIGILYIPFSITFCAIAYLVKSAVPDLNSKEIVFYYIEHFLPIGMKGIMIAGLFAIMMSFAEAQLASSSVIITHDILGKLFSFKISPNRQILLIRIFIITIGVSSFFFISSFTNSHLLSIAWAAFNFYDPLISIPLTAAFLGMNANQKTFISNAIFAILFVLIGRMYAGEFSITSFCFGMLGSVIGFFGMHYYQIIIGLKSVDARSRSLTLSQRINVWVTSIISQRKNHKHINKYREFVIFTLGSYFICALYICFINFNPILLDMLIIGYGLCLMILARDIIFKSRFMSKLQVPFWNLVVIYCLPFVSTYVLLINKGDDFWVINGILSAFSLYFFLDALKYIVFYFVGAALALLFFLSIHDVDFLALSGVAYVIGFILLTSFIFLRSREREQEDRIENMQLFGGAIAHEVRSPLATLNMAAQQLNLIIKELRDDKRLSSAGSQLNTLDELGHMIDKVTVKGIKTVENLLTSLRKSTMVIEEEKGAQSIKDVVESAIEEYSQQHNLRKAPNVSCNNDFAFFGSKHFVKNVIYNLLANSYKYGGPEVEVYIVMKDNKLLFMDNGKGIDEEHIPFIFDKFYTQGNKGATGIGLAFCKMVMEDLGGSISCTSEPNNTVFTLTFPRLIL